MENIKDYAGYNKTMSKSLLDKVWWLDKIPPTITTIIDFGCADGAMFKFIEKMFPHKFRYIGIDNNEEMLQKAKANITYPYTEFYSSLAEMPYTPNAVLVLNSVVHEILTYTTYWEGVKLFDQIQNCGAKYIAIRDMYEHDNPGFAHLIPDSEIDPFLESMKEVQHSSKITHILEYMLKADYKSNWDREVKERYLWRWGHWFWGMGNYDILYEEDFMLPYHRRLWRKRYHIPLTDLRKIRTHKKMLLELKNPT